MEVVRTIHRFLYEGTVANCVNVVSDSASACTLVVKHRHGTDVLADVIDVLRDEEVEIQEIRNTLFDGAQASHTHVRLAAHPGPGLLDELKKKESIFDCLVEHS